MLYVFRLRKLVQIVLNETENPSDEFETVDGKPTVSHCLYEFQKSSKRYTPQLARKVLAIATGQNCLGIVPTSEGQGLILKSEGLVLLTPTGFMNALGGSIAKVSPLMAITISIAALAVSIISLVIGKP